MNRFILSFVLRGSVLFISVVLIRAQEPSQPPAPGVLVDAGGYRVHIYCTGQGEPTVVIAGGGFSFDWGLIQPEVARFTRVCTYDPSGSAWSDPFPKQGDGAAPTCTDRVEELHRVLRNAGMRGPFVLAGFSIGGLIERLYAHAYPQEVRGMVIVDHAFTDLKTGATAQGHESSAPEDSLNRPPMLISSTPIDLGIEDDWNFKKLPLRDQELHLWALSIRSLRPTVEMAEECFDEVNSKTQDQLFPLGDRPLVVISTENVEPAYRSLQEKLLLLSRDSKQIVAEKSSHMVIIDEPEVVIQGIRQVVEAVR